MVPAIPVVLIVARLCKKQRRLACRCTDEDVALDFSGEYLPVIAGGSPLVNYMLIDRARLRICVHLHNNLTLVKVAAQISDLRLGVPWQESLSTDTLWSLSETRRAKAHMRSDCGPPSFVGEVFLGFINGVIRQVSDIRLCC